MRILLRAGHKLFPDGISTVSGCGPAGLLRRGADAETAACRASPGLRRRGPWRKGDNCLLTPDFAFIDLAFSRLLA
jgi:hypothetical protein